MICERGGGHREVWSEGARTAPQTGVVPRGACRTVRASSHVYRRNRAGRTESIAAEHPAAGPRLKRQPTRVVYALKRACLIVQVIFDPVQVPRIPLDR